MRRFLPFALVAALAAAPVAIAPAVAQDLKIAVVDLDLVVANSPAGKALGEKLEAFQESARAEVDAQATKVTDIRKRMAEGANSLTEEKLAELQKEYEDAVIVARRMADDKQREGQKMQTEGLAEIEGQLEPVFEKIREENGYDLILNRVPGVVLMVGERVDITQQVVEALGAGG